MRWVLICEEFLTDGKMPDTSFTVTGINVTNKTNDSFNGKINNRDVINTRGYLYLKITVITH